MTKETRKSLENGLGDLFDPTKVATTIATKTRGLFFALPGRILYNFFQNPSETIEEVSKLNFGLFYDIVTSSQYLRTILLRQWFQALVDMVVTWKNIIIFLKP